MKSPMNTKHSTPPLTDDFQKLDAIAEHTDADSKALAELQEELRRVKQERREDQFYFIFFFILIIDAILFIYLVDGWAALTLGILETIFLMLIADRYEVKYVEIIFKRITGVFAKNHDNS